MINCYKCLRSISCVFSPNVVCIDYVKYLQNTFYAEVSRKFDSQENAFRCENQITRKIDDIRSIAERLFSNKEE